jgi:uncharacterized membrane protein
MSYKTFRIIELGIIVILVSLITFAVSDGVAWIPLPAAVIAVAGLYLLRRRIKEVITDERTETIGNKAARFTFFTGTLIMAFGGATLGAFSHNYPNLQPYANALVFSGGVLMGIYIFASLFYSGKMGGGGVERD